MTLTEFLRTRTEEDRVRATMIFRVRDGAPSFVTNSTDAEDLVTVDGEEMTWSDFRDRFMEHNPDKRGVAEAEAKRRIVETHQHADYSFGNSQAECPKTPTHVLDPTFGRGGAACDTLLILAAVYADHPDYREEWKP